MTADKEASMAEPAAQDNTVAADNTAGATPPPDPDTDPTPEGEPVTDATPASLAEAPVDPEDLATPAPADVAGVIGLLEQALASLRALDLQEG